MATLTEEAQERFNGAGTKNNRVWGEDLASATTIAPIYGKHRVTGSTAIVNITVPYDGFAGSVILVPTGLWTWTAAGNIAVLGSAVVNRAVMFTYNPVTAKWYPSYV